jgi:hypothetical protein
VAYLQQDLGLAEVERMAIMRPNLLKYRLALDGSRAGDADDHALLVQPGVAQAGRLGVTG